MKFLLWAALLGALWWAWRRTGQRRIHPTESAREESIVACARCGVHIPQSEALVGTNGAYFCCSAHREGHDG